MENIEIEKTLVRAGLVFLERDEHFAAGRKMKAIGKGKLNGHGGGLEEGETPEQATIRELEEESRGDRKVGILAKEEDLNHVAICYFKNTKTDGSTFTCRVDVFLLKKWIGELISTEDIKHPAWYRKDNPPVNRMMLADGVWVPLIFSGKKIIVYAEYGPRQETLIGEVRIEYVKSFPEN